ncbi:MAG: ferritin family protein [Candidatus Cloacimonetes bacterium]|jgi:rubrerythrin|nr:ferritin family protein [Candidatus Cloacimonadota bacterium]MDD2507232.1 ferritin family protein [Candidatus Cloacimonadota bacterium]MDD4147657.1 ferritin family protein [Candidatus Cloacimonadota bacterium]MDD4560632.1 ferritin family protein [Candidatus Cloacimonadota bacterium]
MKDTAHLIDSIKKAMQGEMDSINLYQNAAEKSREQEVKEFFLSRREEERWHFNYLLDYYQQLSSNILASDVSNILAKVNLGGPSIFSDSFIRRIGEDQALFSAISTALLLEKDAIDHYHKCAEETVIEALKSFFTMMSKWEMKHYEELVAIQKDAERYYWELNRFEPF